MLSIQFMNRIKLLFRLSVSSPKILILIVSGIVGIEAGCIWFFDLWQRGAIWDDFTVIVDGNSPASTFERHYHQLSTDTIFAASLILIGVTIGGLVFTLHHSKRNRVAL